MQIRQRGKDGKASKQPGISRNTQPDRRSKEGTERTSSIWEGCRANPRAVSMAVLDTGRPLYLCMGKSNRRESGGNEIRERRRYDSGVKGEEAGLYKKAGTLAKKGGRSVETAYRESPLELLLSERAYRLLYKMVMGREPESYHVLEISYSLGLAGGIILFFNHVGGRRLTRDTTPIEVAMKLYERDVDDTLIETADREGKEIE